MITREKGLLRIRKKESLIDGELTKGDSYIKNGSGQKRLEKEKIVKKRKSLILEQKESRCQINEMMLK